jgi:hypothetical protein
MSSNGNCFDSCVFSSTCRVSLFVVGLVSSTMLVAFELMPSGTFRRKLTVRVCE